MLIHSTQYKLANERNTKLKFDRIHSAFVHIHQLTLKCLGLHVIPWAYTNAG